MANDYEHLHVDISPAALEFVGRALKLYLEMIYDDAPDMDLAIKQELHNFVNECRARVQHATAGMPDLSTPAAAGEDWLA